MSAEPIIVPIGPLRTNVVLLGDIERREAIVVDPAIPSLAEISARLAARNWRLVLALSTHGSAYLDRLAEPERQQFRSGRTVVRRGSIAGSNWCTTFHPEQAVRGQLAHGFELVAFLPQGARGNPVQDLTLLRKPG